MTLVYMFLAPILFKHSFFLCINVSAAFWEINMAVIQALQPQGHWSMALQFPNGDPWQQSVMYF